MDYLQEFKPYYESQIEPIIKELEKKRTKRFYISGAVSFTFLFLMTLIGMFSLGFSIEILPGLIFNMLFPSSAAGIITYFIITKLDKSYTQFKLDVIKKIVSYMGEYDYIPDTFIGEPNFLHSGIFEKYISPKIRLSACKGNDYARGKIGDITVEFSELASYYEEITTKTIRHRHKSSHTHIIKVVKTHRLFKGLFFVASFKARFKDNINLYINEGVISDFRKGLIDGTKLISSTASFRYSYGNLVKVLRSGHTEDISDNERISELKTYIPERLIEAMKSNNIKGKMFISYKGNNMYIGIPFEKDLFEPSLTGSLLKYEDIITYFQSINFAVSTFRMISEVKDIWFSASERPEEKLSRGICPWCEMKNSFVNNMCKNCGYIISSTHAEPLEVKKEEKLLRTICPWCEMENSFVNNMCKNCGYRAPSGTPKKTLDDPSDYIRCSACSGNVPQNTKFCGHCGHPMQ